MSSKKSILICIRNMNCIVFIAKENNHFFLRQGYQVRSGTTLKNDSAVSHKERERK